MPAASVAVAARIPGLAWYALAGTVFLAGLTLAAILVWRFVAAFEPATRFLAPGEVQISVIVPGDYIVWHEHRTVYQGRAFDVPQAMPGGTRYRVLGPDGRALAVEPHSGTTSEGSEGRSVSVAHFEVPVSGTYRVLVDGGSGERVMAVGPNRVWPIMQLVGEVSGLVLLALGVAVAIGLYGFLRTVQAPAPGAPSAEAESSLRQLAGLVYGLQAASMLVGVTLFAGVIINYLRRSQVEGTWLESHFTWQIRTFWWSLAWCVLGIATAIVLVGLLILIASAVWFVYRSRLDRAQRRPADVRLRNEKGASPLLRAFFL
jgi:uncharacterized membrane protein